MSWILRKRDGNLKKQVKSELNKAVALSEKGKYVEALAAVNRALEIGSEHPEVWEAATNQATVMTSFKATLLARLGRVEAALRCYDEAALLLKDNERGLADLWYNKGVLLSLNLGMHERAIACYDKTIKISPGYGLAWYNKGLCLSSLGRHEEALSCFEKALNINPKDASTWVNKGSALAIMGKIEDALKCFETALEREPKNSNAWANKGTALKTLGKYEEAEKCYIKALKFGPKDKFVEKMLEECKRLRLMSK